MSEDIMISLDVAATEFFTDNRYNLKGENKILNSDQKVTQVTFPSEQSKITENFDFAAKSLIPFDVNLLSY